MKKVIYSGLILVLLALVLDACSAKKSEEQNETAAENEEVNEPVTETAVAASDNEKEPEGLKLMNASDCGVCHKVDQKLIGPSYQEIADKYENSSDVVSKLSDKVIKGSVGVWGQVPMTAHPTLSKEDADKMVEYILSLKP